MNLINDKKFLVLLAAGAMFVASPVMAADETSSHGSDAIDTFHSSSGGEGDLGAGREGSHPEAGGSHGAGSVSEEALNLAALRGEQAARAIIHHAHSHTTSDVLGGAELYKSVSRDVQNLFNYSRNSVYETLGGAVESITGFDRAHVEYVFTLACFLELGRWFRSYASGDKHVSIFSVLYTFTRETFPVLGLEEVKDGNVEGALLKGLSNATNFFAGQLSATYEAVKAPRANVKRLAVTTGLLGVGCLRGWLTTDGVNLARVCEDANVFSWPARVAAFATSFRRSNTGGRGARKQ